MPSTITNFPLFSKFPTEIRLKIWQYAAQHPRVLDFSAKVPGNSPSIEAQYLRFLKRHEFHNRILGTGFRSEVRWLTSAPQPAMFSVCAESREVAQGVYTLAFDLGGTYRSAHTAYINPQLDTIYCNTSSSLMVHYLLSDLESCDAEGSGALMLALNETCFAESLVCRPPDGLRGSKYMEGLEALVLITEQDGDIDPLGNGAEWRLVEGTMALAQQMSFQYRLRKRPVEFFDFAMRGIDVEKRPELKLAALRRGDTRDIGRLEDSRCLEDEESEVEA